MPFPLAELITEKQALARKCAICQVEFKPYRPSNIYCSGKCRRQNWLNGWYKDNQERQRINAKAYYQANKQRELARGKRRNAKDALAAKKLVNPRLECANCGCDIVELLEFNHINGGGYNEIRKLGKHIPREILAGRRAVDDLNLLCHVCNHLHYVEMKGYPGAFKVTFLLGGDQ